MLADNYNSCLFNRPYVVLIGFRLRLLYCTYTREYLIKLVRQYIPATHCNKVVHDKRSNQVSSKHGEPGFSPIHQRMTISYLSTGNPHIPGKVRPYPLNDMILELALID